MEETEPGSEKDSLKKRLDEVEEKFNDLKKTSYERQRDIDELYPRSHTYHDNYVTFSVYLLNVEKHKNGFEPVSTDKKKIVKQIADVKVRVFG